MQIAGVPWFAAAQMQKARIQELQELAAGFLVVICILLPRERSAQGR
jgi:hypothetical protein